MGSSDSRKKGRCAGGAYGSGLSGCPEFIADHEFLRAFRQYLSLPETACERNCLAAHAQVIFLQFLRKEAQNKCCPARRRKEPMRGAERPVDVRLAPNARGA